MDFDFSGNGLQDIAALVAGLVALGLALQAAVGPTVMLLTEAVKAAFNTPPGKGGIIAIGMGCLIGLSLGFLTAIVSDASTAEYIGLALCGGFAGLFMGAGAVKEHKASGSINTEASAAIETTKGLNEQEFVNGYAAGHDEGIRTLAYQPEQSFASPVAEPAFEEGDTGEDEFDSVIQAGPEIGSPILNHQTGSDLPDVQPKAVVTAPSQTL